MFEIKRFLPIQKQWETVKLKMMCMCVLIKQTHYMDTVGERPCQSIYICLQYKAQQTKLNSLSATGLCNCMTKKISRDLAHWVLFTQSWSLATGQTHHINIHQRLGRRLRDQKWETIFGRDIRWEFSPVIQMSHCRKKVSALCVVVY